MKFSLTALAAMASAASAAITCGAGKLCPQDTPCCSLYGECGTGSYCLGPCDPKYSFNLTSCAPAPVCKNGDYTFATRNRIAQNTMYLGDANSYDFVANNDILNYNGNLLLTMANGSTGTVLTSTRAIWYGKVSATLKTSRTQGVVSSFILMSGVRDEIDYEFIGSFLETAQTNYYWQEALDYTKSRNITLSDTFQNFHTYEIDWTQDSITWSVDGQVGRVLNKKDTFNATTQTYNYPQTPSFIQVSIWPGGLASNAEGTINWAGGEVNWNSPDISNPGYFYVTLKDVSVTCYDPPASAKVLGNNAYVYNNVAGLSENVVLTNDQTVLGSFQAVGFNMNKGSDNGLAVVSGSVPTGVGSGNNHSADDNSNIPAASGSPVSPSSGGGSIPDASGSGSSNSMTSTKASPTSSAAGGFQQGSASPSSTSGSKQTNGASGVTAASGIMLGAAFLAGLFMV